MKTPYNLELKCSECETGIPFSLFDLNAGSNPMICCPNCSCSFLFEDETLRRQLHLFSALCHQLRESEEILSNTSIAINLVGQNTEVEVPYKLLLTRLNSKLRLNLGGKEVSIIFRMDTSCDQKTLTLT